MRTALLSDTDEPILTKSMTEQLALPMRHWFRRETDEPRLVNDRKDTSAPYLPVDLIEKELPKVA
jgi:hypothetical protein